MERWPYKLATVTGDLAPANQRSSDHLEKRVEEFFRRPWQVLEQRIEGRRARLEFQCDAFQEFWDGRLTRLEQKNCRQEDASRQEIKKLQTNVKIIILEASFTRLVRDIVHKERSGLRMQPKAIPFSRKQQRLPWSNSKLWVTREVSLFPAARPSASREMNDWVIYQDYASRRRPARE